MDKVNLLEYVNLMNRYDEQAQLGMTLVFTENDKNLMRYMRRLAMQDEETRKFLNSINDLKPEEREQAVNEYFNETSKEELNTKKTKLVTLDEIKNYQDIISSMNKEDSNKLNYLINNYKKLNIQYINLDTLTYIDENNQERQVSKTDMDVLSSNVEDELDDKTFINDAIKMTKKTEEDVEDILKVKSKDEQSGYISAMLLFALTAFTGGILATIVTLILNR